MSSIDEQFVEFVVKSLVNKPDSVKVERRIDEKGVLLELTVDPEDLGRVIGKRGATAQSIRTLLRALGTKNDARYNLKIIDNGIGEHARPSYNDDRQSSRPQTSTDAGDDSSSDDSSNAPKDDDDALDNTMEPTENEAEEAAEEAEKDTTSDRLSQTRKELEDLDDLDV
jgi:predicted RNA-binding protein YlqC (UPF0109 family)